MREMRSPTQFLMPILLILLAPLAFAQSDGSTSDGIRGRLSSENQSFLATCGMNTEYIRKLLITTLLDLEHGDSIGAGTTLNSILSKTALWRSAELQKCCDTLASRIKRPLVPYPQMVPKKGIDDKG